MDIVKVADQLADEVLFPAANATDASGAVPAAQLDQLGRAGLFGVAAPREAGGLDADFRTVCGVLEALSSGCLSTAFLWMQHISVTRALAASANESLRDRWLGPLTSGAARAGLALGGALPRPALRASLDGRDWLVEGVSPFVSGWGAVDVVHAAVRAGDEVVWLLIDAEPGPTLRAERLRLIALDATATVRLGFGGLRVAGGRVTGRNPAGDRSSPELLRMHACLPLGVASRCARLIGPSPLDAELASLRAELDQLGPATAAARADAGELAVRAASALMATEGSRSLLAGGHAQRLAREALFTQVYALRPASKEALLTRLGAASPGE
ncbi:MAG TPA: acyl-CoA dehydrogenase family protein [Streptosporangiaceae bacterium]